MKIGPTTGKSSEHNRLAALKELALLDTPDEAVFDDITRLVSRIFDMPIVAISLIDLNRQWFKSKVGLGVRETPRNISFCTYAIEQDDCYVVEDAVLSDVHQSSPLVTGPPFIRFYAGVPVRSADGEKVGTICVIDSVPRQLTGEQRSLLKIFAQQISKIFEMRKKNQLKKDLIRRQEENEKELSTLLRQLHVIIEHVPANIVASDTNGRVRFVNKGFCNMLALSDHPKDLVGQPLEAIFENSFERNVISKEQLNANRLLSQTEVSTAILPFALPNGRVYEGDLVRITRGDKWFGHLWCYRDITEKMLSKKTIEAQQMQLAESARLKAIGHMAAGVAHEINNPLTTIQGRATHLMSMAQADRIDNEVLMKYAQHINVVVERIVKIIRGLKALARDGEADAPECVSVKKIIDDTLSFCQSKIKFLGVELILPPSHQDALVLCRQQQASQVLLNLLNNACDALEGASTKWIRMEIVTTGATADIKISNSGPTIERGLVERIFDPFFTTKGPDKGTGMGLSISKSIAENNAGRLYLDQASEYTTFVFQLPLEVQSKTA